MSDCGAPWQVLSVTEIAAENRSVAEYLAQLERTQEIGERALRDIYRRIGFSVSCSTEAVPENVVAEVNRHLGELESERNRLLSVNDECQRWAERTRLAEGERDVAFKRLAWLEKRVAEISTDFIPRKGFETSADENALALSEMRMALRRLAELNIMPVVSHARSIQERAHNEER